MIDTVRMRQLLPLRANLHSLEMLLVSLSQFYAYTHHCNREKLRSKAVYHKKFDTKGGSALSANFIDTIHPLATLPICERVMSKPILCTTRKNEDQRVETAISAFLSMNRNCFLDQ